MGWMNRVNNAKLNSKNTYVGPGRFRVELIKVKSGETRQKIENFIVELRVVESDNPANPVGSLMDWYVNMAWDSSDGDVAKFLMTATGDPQEALTEEVVKFITSDAQPLKGTILQIGAYNKVTKGKGGNFTVVGWFAGDATPEQVAKFVTEGQEREAKKQAA